MKSLILQNVLISGTQTLIYGYVITDMNMINSMKGVGPSFKNISPV